MNNIEKTEKLKSSLSAIEQELKKLNLWSFGKARPEDSAFESLIPFCMDTMDFHQWLEYVLIPRMRILVQEQRELPENVLIHTYAQEIYRGRWQEYKELIKILMEFDKIFEK
ncbi:MAG: YqcC family protein [Succinivibrio sp.]